jgi:cellulose synthase/poly-beta-1,6-N-acetylglucosamine synthase-like glycosyltransferase
MTDLILQVLFVISLLIYAAAMAFICLYACIQAHLWYAYNFKKKKEPKPELDINQLPYVTIQLPVYNEKFVIDRLINSICQIEYPGEKLEIQVLDDSTDDSILQTANIIEHWKSKGIQIEHIHRTNRIGFKAGALRHGLLSAKGEFIAIFDADFIPNKDFLLKIISEFTDPQIGAVQTRWAHLNRIESVLTNIQALVLDMHFSIEQAGRSNLGAFLNFNGTGGIWRKTCIIDAGNWQDDTLTEDLDLSYRAQLKGWKIQYREDVECPAELPAVMSAIKSQQFRWNKGGAEVARKLLHQVFKSDIPFQSKIHATFHLLNSSIFAVILLASIVSIPLSFGFNTFTEWQFLLTSSWIFMISMLILSVNFLTSFLKYSKLPFYTFPFYFLMFLCVSIGLCLHNGIAVIQGLSGHRTPFIRTPKTGTTSKSWASNIYLREHIRFSHFHEILLALVFGILVFIDFQFNLYGLMGFHTILTFGLGIIGISGLIHLGRVSR